MGFIFIPLTVIGYATLPVGLRTDAAAVFALLRNFSASAGIAMMTALVAHNLQLIHSELGSRLTEARIPVLDNRVIASLSHAWRSFAAMIDVEVNRQA